MQGSPAAPRRCARRDQIVPHRQLPAQVALRQLEQERRERLPDRLDICRGDQPVAAADQDAAETVKCPIAAFLVRIQMALRMERDGAMPPPVGMDTERDLLRHRAAREPDRGVLAE